MGESSGGPRTVRWEVEGMEKRRIGIEAVV